MPPISNTALKNIQRRAKRLKFLLSDEKGVKKISFADGTGKIGARKKRAKNVRKASRIRALLSSGYVHATPKKTSAQKLERIAGYRSLNGGYLPTLRDIDRVVAARLNESEAA